MGLIGGFVQSGGEKARGKSCCHLKLPAGRAQRKCRVFSEVHCEGQEAMGMIRKGNLTRYEAKGFHKDTGTGHLQALHPWRYAALHWLIH